MGGLTTFWHRRGTLAVAAAAALVVFWLAIHSEGSDWYICQTHADILYSAILRFRQFPFFSFAFNGGTYFLQDPQNNLYSPTTLLILAAGPTLGLRLSVALWAGFGCWAFIAWMRRYVDEAAAQVAALAWVVSLGVLWRVAIGNDMFLWHLGLPLLLLLVDNVLRERTIWSALALGLAFGLYILGPTFHSFTYLVLPTLPLFVAFALASSRPTPRQLGRIALLVGGAVVVAIVIASPKLVSWARFPMRRQTPADDVIPLGEGLRALVDYAAVAWVHVPTVARENLRDPWWGVEESAVALPPIATLLMLVGAAAALAPRPLSLRRGAGIGRLALVFVAVGLILACTPSLWRLFRLLTHGNFRVAPRFLAIAGFGAAVGCAVGSELVVERWPRARLPFTLTVLAAQILCALGWVHAAGKAANRTSNDAVQPATIEPWARARVERAELSRLRSFGDLVRFERGQRRILEGHGYADGFLVVGNDFNPQRWGSALPRPTVDGAPARNVTFGHTRIVLRDVAPGARILLRIIDPPFGLTMQPSDGSGAVALTPTAEGVVVTNRGSAVIRRIEIVAALPVSPPWFWLSAATIALSAIALVVRRRRRPPASA